MSTKKTIKIGDKEVSLTNDGFPNKRQLNKIQRQVVDEIREKKKNLEIEKQKAEIYKALGVKE